ncbi:hypothetical protein DAPPUDRAFT_255925 [Daphnia pulex]|uniref:Uncharacterized protein n=1 Tax=Daphnia pulex TaxID=6669 RepID=E9HAC9_DAPPU|nr:hypothetical protein DAPPUDRAFT_255925 [Daphnia pulex]|eukprot:EFX71316.1 hypothetical protein DAPPUDRAFT_255925 [Daphnia pulex]
MSLACMYLLYTVRVRHVQKYKSKSSHVHLNPKAGEVLASSLRRGWPSSQPAEGKGCMLILLEGHGDHYVTGSTSVLIMRPSVPMSPGYVDSKQQQRINSTPRCSLNTQQRQHTQHLLTTLMLVSTTPPRLQDYTKTYASLSYYTEVFLCPELQRYITKAPEYYTEAPNYYSDHSYYTEAAACYTTKAVDYYTETYCRALFVTLPSSSY